MKDVITVFSEAIVVGVFLIVFYYGVEMIMPDHEFYKKLFISGVVFHLIFEYTGINILYVKHYQKIL